MVGGSTATRDDFNIPSFTDFLDRDA